VFGNYALLIVCLEIFFAKFTNTMILGNKIKSLREKKGITPKNLAAAMDIDISTLNRLENGKVATFKPQFLEKLASYLEVEVSDFFASNVNMAIYDNDKGQNINALSQTKQNEKLETLYEKLLHAKDNEIQLLKEQINILKSSLSNIPT
jgi:transcriptional regulator with XRE-family HTH domain